MYQYNRVLNFLKHKNKQLQLVDEIFKRLDSSRKSSKVNLGQIQSILCMSSKKVDSLVVESFVV